MIQYSVKYKTVAEGKTRGKYRIVLNQENELRAKEEAKQYLQKLTEKDLIKREITEIIELQRLLNNATPGIKQVFHD